MPWGDFKVIPLDEADYPSEGQAALRGVMEQYLVSLLSQHAIIPT